MDITILDRAEERQMPATQEAMAEMFGEIQPAYFKEGSFDATQHELDKMLGPELEIDELERERLVLKKHLQVVSKRIATLISANSLAFNRQVGEYAEIASEAQCIVTMLTSSRKALRIVRDKLHIPLKIVGNQRQRGYLLQLKKMLRILREMRGVRFEVEHMVQRKAFFPAIETSILALSHAERYPHLACIRGLVEVHIQALKLAVGYVDGLFALSTRVFEPNRYSLAISVYRLTDTLETAPAKLQTFFKSALETTCREIVAELATRFEAEFPHEDGSTVGEQQSNGQDARPNEQMRELEHVYKVLPPEEIIPAMRKIGIALTTVLHNYHLILGYHMREDARNLHDAESADEPPPEDDSAVVIEKGVFQSLLLNNLHSIFENAAEYFNQFLLTAELPSLKFDEFLEVVEASISFQLFGKRHFGVTTRTITETIEKMTCRYFDRYHAERQDELKMFLENETFTLCPISSHFRYLELPEFHFLRDLPTSSEEQCHNRLSTTSIDCCNALGERLDFELLADTNFHHPFNPPLHEEHSAIEGEVMNSREGPPMCEQECGIAGDQADGPTPILCNTALSILRFYGRYLHMAFTLPIMSERVIGAIVELYSCYFLMISIFFCTDPEPSAHQAGIELSTPRLRRITDAIRRDLIWQSGAADSAAQTINGVADTGEGKPSQAPPHGPCLSDCVALKDMENLYGLSERIVGVESILFLGRQLVALRPTLQKLLANKQRSKALDSLYAELIPSAEDMRSLMCGCVASKLLNHQTLVKEALRTNWNVHEIQSQHSAYVDSLLSEATAIASKISRVADLVPLPPELLIAIWSSILSQIFRSLVYALAEASRKCSSEGRALMLLDFEHLNKGLETATGLKPPLPHRMFLENYIKAFFLPRETLDSWIVKHTEYNVQQVTALMNSHSSPAKKTTKSILMNFLDNLDS